ncbi:MAG: Wzz/FepE/Etk N-terminal domain-containing protein, partial [Coriobacteriales bacterium]|nr:Wzz/FepE/Etk N-terminal domain-containing protein [Coriobacteriales bacterium]
SLLRRHFVLVIVLPIITGLITFGVVMLMPNEYTASTTMYVLSRNEAEASAALTQQDLNTAQMLTNDVTTLIKSDRIKNDVSTHLGLSNLKGFKINVTSSTTTRVITLSVTNADPQLACDVANAIVDDVSIVAQEVMQIQSVNVIDTAQVPTSPSGPRRLMYTAVGALGGLFLAVAIVVLRDSLDTRVRSGQEVEEIVGIPVVGHFPEITR